MCDFERRVFQQFCNLKASVGPRGRNGNVNEWFYRQYPSRR
jgi:hypothetical protein